MDVDAFYSSKGKSKGWKGKDKQGKGGKDFKGNFKGKVHWVQNNM